MKISKMELKFSSLFFVPFMGMLGVFLCLGSVSYTHLVDGIDSDVCLAT